METLLYHGEQSLWLGGRTRPFYVESLDPLGPAPRGQFRDGVWRTTEGGALEIAFSTGFHGYVLNLRLPESNGRTPRRLAGRVRAFTDYDTGREDPEARVAIRRIECPSGRNRSR